MPNTDSLDRTLFISDNLPFLQSLDTESVDLVVIDPPFGKNQTFEGTLRPPLTDEELGHEYDLLSRWGIQNEDDAYDAGLEFPDQSRTTAKFSDIWNFRYQITQADWDRLDKLCRPARHLIEAERYTHSESTAAYITFMTIWDAFVREWGTRCWYCGTEKARDRRELELDHIVPNKRDGTNDDCWNRALACAPCNSDKDDKLTVEQTIDKALAAGRIQTPALRDEQVAIFEQRHEWAKARWEGMQRA